MSESTNDNLPDLDSDSKAKASSDGDGTDSYCEVNYELETDNPKAEDDDESIISPSELFELIDWQSSTDKVLRPQLPVTVCPFLLYSTVSHAEIQLRSASSPIIIFFVPSLWPEPNPMHL